MDLAIEANRNSALFNTMQQVLDVYNPLLHKARPTVVNETKHRIRVSPTRWATTLDTWNGAQSVRFDLPRIGSLVDFSLKCAFRIPGQAPTEAQRQSTGDRGFADTGLSIGTATNNQNAVGNNARGRFDRLYADRLLGFNMIRSYTVSSKSRRIFSASGEYLLLRFSQMDDDMKEAVMNAISPVDVMDASVDNNFYAPGISYTMSIPLFMFFNEHITNSLDVNFSEEVHIDIDLRPPSQLFYYGQLGDLTAVPSLAAVLTNQAYVGGVAGLIAWDQALITAADNLGIVEAAFPDNAQVQFMQEFTKRHIQGISQPISSMGAGYGAVLGPLYSGPTFAYPDVDSQGKSIQIQFEANADYIVQDTDAYRALRQQMYPEGTGLTTITYDTTQEVFQNLFSGAENNLLDARSGGTFVDPGQSASGITVGNTNYFVDLPLRTNNLVFSTSFMVRKHSDMGGDGNTEPGTTVRMIGGTDTDAGGFTPSKNTLGAHRIYSRCLPVHYFMIMAAGRVVYESDGETQLNLTQSGMYSGTGNEWGSEGTDIQNRSSTTTDKTTSSGRPFNVYTVNFGLEASRLENTGCLSLQNLNNPTLRIYFKPDTWAEYDATINPTTGKSDRQVAAAQGVQIDVMHEFFNVTTINSGNGEITSGLNQ